ncbi:MAG: PEP-CTERM sorting domain-containing protein [Pirellulales bacterium]
MRISGISSCFGALVLTLFVSQALAETVQTAGDVFDGRPFLYVEGESFESLTGAEATGWKVVTKGGPDLSVGSLLPILPASSNVSDSAIWAQASNFAHAHTASYDLKFITPGIYQFYLRMSLYDNNADGVFGSEDSIFLPPEFNKNSSTDWVGFEGLQFDESDPEVEIPTPGFALDPDGYKPDTGNHDRDGLLELAFQWPIKDEGVVTQHNATGTLAANGNFNWYNKPTYQGINAAGGFDGFFGMKTEFEVTEEMVGETVTFELGTREVNVVIDGFMFIQVDGLFIAEGDLYPKNDLLDLFSQAEVDAAVLPQPVVADYNGDGTVNSADYAVWRDGGSPDDTQAGYDLWKANFGSSGSGAGSGVVPEPASIGLVLLGLGILAVRFRR